MAYKTPYNARKRHVLRYFNRNPKKRNYHDLDKNVVFAFFTMGLTLADTAEILQVPESDVKFSIDVAYQRAE